MFVSAFIRKKPQESYQPNPFEATILRRLSGSLSCASAAAKPPQKRVRYDRLYVKNLIEIPYVRRRIFIADRDDEVFWYCHVMDITNQIANSIETLEALYFLLKSFKNTRIV